MHMNMVDYIAAVRVQKAKELLKTDLPLHTVSDMVGINNRTTFVRMFKKVEGVTLGEFRRLLNTPE